MLRRRRRIPDRTSDKTFFEKIQDIRNCVDLHITNGATVPWQISNLGKHMSINIQ